jgi:phosphatidylglycerol:prolipoprotein diacylglycerol transferase
MCRVLFEFAGFPIYSYWFFYGLGLLSSILLAIWLAHRRSLDMRKVWFVSVVAVVVAVVFARLSAVFFGTRFSDLLNLQKSGQFSFGASLAVLLILVLLAKPLKISVADVFDISACAIPLAQGIQRIGCFLNGCCFGPVSTSFLAVRFPKIVDEVDGRIIGTQCFIHHLKTGLVGPDDLYSLPVFPTQLASLLVCLVVSGICVWLFVRKKLEGKILGIYFVLYGALRFILQWYRPDYDKNNSISGWNTGHSICLIMLLAGIIILLSKNPAKKFLLSQRNLSD